ncbi:MAG: GNAT family N-acetyltransferase [Elusimicrobia bacterium]|nr:GNAT family N-acetyltransferase [Elusimicrobiota bacterium]
MRGRTRSARPEDAPAVAKIARRPFAAGWSAAQYAEEARRPESVFLVWDDGGVRGYAVARLFEGEVRLLDLAAAEDGRGIGRGLWMALVAAAAARGARRLTLEVSERNVRARKFYRRLGAHEAGRRPDFYPDGSAAILLDAVLPRAAEC